MVPDHRHQRDRHLDQRVQRPRFFGTITVDINGELAKLDTDGYRPLRHIPATASTVN